MLQFGVSLTDDASSVNYDCNMFMIQATVGLLKNWQTNVIDIYIHEVFDS
jgi:hypothetical protein